MVAGTRDVSGAPLLSPAMAGGTAELLRPTLVRIESRVSRLLKPAVWAWRGVTWARSKWKSGHNSVEIRALEPCQICITA